MEISRLSSECAGGEIPLVDRTPAALAIKLDRQPENVNLN